MGLSTGAGRAQDAAPALEIDKLGAGGLSQLHLAATRGLAPQVKQLLQQGANVNIQHGRYKSTPLQYAAARGHADVARLLMQNGATIDSMDSLSRTPLAWAVDKNQPGIAELLLHAGADVYTKRNSVSVLDRLKKSGNSDLVAVFDRHFSKQPRNQWLLWQAEQLTFTGELDGRQEQMWHSQKPALSIPADATPETTRGRFDVWLSNRIPKAVSVYVVRRNGKLLRVLTLLREEKVEASLDGKMLWQPAKKMDFAWRQLPASTAVATTIDDGEERLLEMMKLAQRFTMPGHTLMKQPVARYENDLDGYKVPDGGVFVFLKDGLPAGIVCLEMRRGKSYEWFYAVARQTSRPGAILLDNEPVMEWSGYWTGPRKLTDAFVEQPLGIAPQ
jgi:hypothetical protein